MSPSVAVIAALPREIAPLVRGWERHASRADIDLWSKGSVVVACAGMGAERAALAVGAALALQPAQTLYSVGLAGACDPAYAAGRIVVADQVIDARSGERFGAAAPSITLVSSPGLASVREKRRLFASYGAAAVDMEAATVGRLARAHSIDFLAIKAISDGVDFELQDLGRFATRDGRFREAAFALHAAVRPALWGTLFTLAGNSRRAIAALTQELRSRFKLER